MNEITRFEAHPYDRLTVVFTYVLTPLLFIALAAKCYSDFSSYCAQGLWIDACIVVVFFLFIAGVFVLMYMLSVGYYIISFSEIIIVRKVLGSFGIPLATINSVAVVEKPGIAFRVLAYAAMWGYYGRFFSEDDNRTVRIYATNLRNMVRIETTDGKIFYLSPAEPEKFVEAVKQRLHKTEP
ncbi:hypothetical protein DXX99_01290 [Ammonifex thiophilus]|uniref:Bacterial Pleckstrin homology domain-containing protein n=2 Tax=Ammonifex thiophilus TaxID=444093 RepID=A0A3D8P5W3_9THEO|nr:hypothetical protein DXX99_01290 [Ammonifex thiophilus]